MLPDFHQLEKILEIKFDNLDLLKEALTHRSYLNENPRWRFSHNERLEFLGDAALELVVSQYLFHQYPHFEEGFLTNLRAALVNSDSLYEIAKSLKLDKYLLLSRGEARDLTKGRSYLLTNALEAVIGAIYLDQGIKKLHIFLKKVLLTKIEKIILDGSYKDAKSLFQEKSQGILGITPIYKTLKSWGPDHAKQFSIGVYLKDELIAIGEGFSKQEAELNAAQKALVLKGW